MNKSLSSHWYRNMTATRDGVMRMGFYIICVAAGLGVFLVLHKFGVTTGPLGAVSNAFHKLYSATGILMFALAPLTIRLGVLVGAQLGHHAGWWVMDEKNIMSYEMIIDVGTSVALLGTFLYLTIAILTIDMSQSVLVLMQKITFGLGRAMISSIWGIGMVPIARLMLHFWHRSQAVAAEDA